MKTKSHALDHVMGVWLGALTLATVFVALSPADEAVAATSPRAHVSRGVYATAAEKHCMVQTALGEATPGHKAEVIAIMRGMLKRRAMGRWGDLCGVALAKKQYSTFNNRAMPKKPRKPSKLYRKYSQWADLALIAGPSRFDHYIHPKTMVRLYRKKYPKWWKACKETAYVGAAKFCRMWA